MTGNRKKVLSKVGSTFTWPLLNHVTRAPFKSASQQQRVTCFCSDWLQTLNLTSWSRATTQTFSLANQGRGKRGQVINLYRKLMRGATHANKTHLQHGRLPSKAELPLNSWRHQHTLMQTQSPACLCGNRASQQLDASPYNQLLMSFFFFFLPDLWFSNCIQNVIAEVENSCLSQTESLCCTGESEMKHCWYVLHRSNCKDVAELSAPLMTAGEQSSSSLDGWNGSISDGCGHTC